LEFRVERDVTGIVEQQVELRFVRSRTRHVEIGEFITPLGVAATWPLTARAQQPPAMPIEDARTAVRSRVSLRFYAKLALALRASTDAVIGTLRARPFQHSEVAATVVGHVGGRLL